MIKASTYGPLQPNLKFEKEVSISTDSITYNPNSEFKVLVQLEPPEVLNNVNAIIKNHQNFDLILAWHPEIIKRCPNAKEFVFGSCWVDMNTFNADKQNEISFLMSNKAFAPGHKFRHAVWNSLDKSTYGDFKIRAIKTPPRIPDKNIIFKHAKFSITIENVARENWFTEKLIDCFTTKTIPIYYGCPNIGKWFNEDGIIKFNTLEELKTILNTLTPEDYNKRLEAAEDNLKRALPYHDYFKRVENEIIGLWKK
jgi:hypothetical protein